MDAKINAKKVIAKRDRNRVLGALSYVAGFPLLILFTFIFSIPFISGTGFSGLTKYYGVLVCVAAWLVITLIQIIAAIVTRNCTARGVIVIVFTLIVMVGGPVYFDIWAAKQVDEARVSYVRDVYGLAEDEEVDLKEKYSDIDIKDYNYQINHYLPWTNKGSLTGDFNGMVDEFCRVYNVGYGSSVKGSVNTDGSKYGKALERTNADGEAYNEYWFGEKGEVYKENGLYADGYIFSLPVANEILITYYETQAQYKAEKKDADKELEKALKAAKNGSAWREYTRSDEYKAAYGEGGTADSYMITEGRLSEILKTLGVQIVDNKVLEGLPTNLLGFNLAKIVDDALKGMGLTQNDLKNLSLDKVLGLVKGLGLDVSKDDIMALLAGYSNYEVSNVKPLMYFIEDETLRTYAYAKYFGQTHGANIGSVLIPTVTTDADGVTTYGNVGKITMSASGLNYKENAFELNECYKLKALNSYAPKLYPLFAARRYAYIFAGIISLMYAIFYYSQMKVKLLGKKLEKMSTLGGAR